MDFTLQYQAHVDDLTSLAGNPEDVSWFVSLPPETPRAPAPPLRGATTDDLHSSAAVVADDQSWFATFSPEGPIAPVSPLSGFQTDDLHSGAAVAPDDQSWFATFPYTPAVDRKLGAQGLHAGDLHEAAAEPADVSWFVVFPSRMPLAIEPPALGFLAADIHAGAATGVIWTIVGDVFRFVSADHAINAFALEMFWRAIVGTHHAELFNITTSSAVTSSGLSTASGSFVRSRSGTLALTDGHDYRVRVGVVGAEAGEFVGAKVLAI